MNKKGFYYTHTLLPTDYARIFSYGFLQGLRVGYAGVYMMCKLYIVNYIL